MKILVTVVGLLLASPASASVDHYSTIEQMQNTHQTTNCFYFTLVRVSQADPVVPGSPWFAMHRDTQGAGDTYAMLLAAKLSGSRIRITTTGALMCGYAGIVYAILQ